MTEMKVYAQKPPPEYYNQSIKHALARKPSKQIVYSKQKINQQYLSNLRLLMWLFWCFVFGHYVLTAHVLMS